MLGVGGGAGVGRVEGSKPGLHLQRASEARIARAMAAATFLPRITHLMYTELYADKPSHMLQPALEQWDCSKHLRITH